MASNNNNNDLNNDENNNNPRRVINDPRRSQLNPRAAPFNPRGRSITQPITQIPPLSGSFQSPLVFPNQLSRLGYTPIQNPSMIQPDTLDMVSPPISPGVDPYWFHLGFPPYPHPSNYPYPTNPSAFYNTNFTPSINPMTPSALNMFVPMNPHIPNVLQQTANEFSGLGVFPNSNPQYTPNRLFPLKSNVSSQSELGQDVGLGSDETANPAVVTDPNPNPINTSTNVTATTNLPTIPETSDAKPAPRPRTKSRRTSNASEAEPKEVVCPYEGCARPFKRAEHLKRHIMSIHHKDKPHQCPFPGCGKCFSRSDNLTQHIRSHSKQGSYHRKRNFTR